MNIDASTSIETKHYTNKSLLSGHEASLQVAYQILVPIFGLCIIIFNFIVLVSSGLILKKRPEPRPTYLLLGNVALADLTAGLSWIFSSVYPEKYANHWSCVLSEGLVISSTLVSGYSVGLIAFDRYLYIVHCLRYKALLNSRRVYTLIVLVWLFCSTIGYLPLMGWYGDTNDGKTCWFIFLTPPNLIILTLTVGLVPMITTIILYSIILYYAIRKISQLQMTNQQSTLKVFNIEDNFLRQGQQRSITTSADLKVPKKWKAIKVVIFTSGSFVVTWFPYYIATYMYAMTCRGMKTQSCKQLEDFIGSPLVILGFLNSLLNPIIYAWWHKGFRGLLTRYFEVYRMDRANSVKVSVMERPGFIYICPSMKAVHF